MSTALHVAPLANSDTSNYPFLLVGLKAVSALAARGTRSPRPGARATADAGRRLLAALGSPAPCGAAPAAALSPRVWLRLVRRDLGRLPRPRPTPKAPSRVAGRCSRRACTPSRCRSSRRSPFSLALALAASPRFLSRDRGARGAHARARPPRLETGRPLARPASHGQSTTPAPRRRFGLAFESRPPPLGRSPEVARQSAVGDDVVASFRKEDHGQPTFITEPGGARSTIARAPPDLTARPDRPGRGLDLGAPAAVSPHPAPPARPGVLVAPLEPQLLVVAAGLVFTLVVARPLLADLEREGAAAALRWSTGCSPPGSSSSGSCLLAEALVGPRGLADAPLAGVPVARRSVRARPALWPVMAFFTNSAIHMYAHGLWAEGRCSPGAAELGLVTAGCAAAVGGSTWPLAFVVTGDRRSSSTSRTPGSSRARPSCTTCSAGRSSSVRSSPLALVVPTALGRLASPASRR